MSARTGRITVLPGRVGSHGQDHGTAALHGAACRLLLARAERRRLALGRKQRKPLLVHDAGIGQAAVIHVLFQDAAYDGHFFRKLRRSGRCFLN